MRKTLKLNKVKISKINNVNAIIGGGTTDDTLEVTLIDYTCEPERCTITTTTNNDNTEGEATGRFTFA